MSGDRPDEVATLAAVVDTYLVLWEDCGRTVNILEGDYL